MVVDEFQSKAADMMKKVLTVGVGALFLTEESLRGLVSDIKLPKELINAILDSAGKTKSEFLRGFSSEILSKVMEKVQPSALIQEILDKNEIEFRVKVSFKPKKKV
jgi:hypothetical protein